jgi:TRAP-type mannitol/chloroaromatic compound transport system substrate-binding protein
MNSNMTYEFHYENIQALQKLKSLNINIHKFPKDVMDSGKVALKEVISELSSKNNDFDNVYKSIKSHLNLSKDWSDASLKYFLNER